MDERDNGGNAIKIRRDWELNHARIRDAFVTILKREERMPSLSEIADHLNLDYTTVQRHYKEMKFDVDTSAAKVLTDDIVMSIAKSAKKGNVQAQKLWLQFIENWSEKIKQDHTSDGKPVGMIILPERVYKEVQNSIIPEVKEGNVVQ